MNNNNQNGKESDIITRKGFLISLPGKKKAETSNESSIHMSASKDNNDGSVKDGEKNGNMKNFRHKRNNELQKQSQQHNSSEKKNNSYDQNHKKKGKNKDKFRRDNKNVKELHPQSSVLGEKTENTENNRQNFKYKNKNFRNDKHKAHHNDRNDHTEELRSHDKNERNDRNGNNKINKNTTPPLSALSAEITNYTPKQTKSEPAVPVQELSLEEKYKNAKPLSEQIAEQEMRAKGIKVNDRENSVQESVEIVGVRFREAGKIYYFDPGEKKFSFGTPVIVETARGSEYGYVAISNRLVPCNSLTSPLKHIERVATEIDTQKHVANRELEAQAEEVFKTKVAKLGLEMNLIYVEYTFDNSRLLFYFTAETRIDFRELVKELASVFRTRIELRQIGVRDEAKAIGGIGVCGRANCCNTFLGDFAQVSIKMAKDQSLSLNAAKISGACGKLMCCLRYEDKVYEEENARTPKVGSIVETPEGRGHVVERNVLKGTVKVSLDLAPEAAAQLFSRDEIKVIGYNKQNNNDQEIDENLDEIKDTEE